MKKDMLESKPRQSSLLSQIICGSYVVPILFVTFLFIPWLGEMLFYSKGEPREAIVAVSMLDSGNWILPVSYGGDIPYKPPFLAWLIALASLLFNGGVVNEFTSRLPSAIASIFLLIAIWRIVKSRFSYDRAWITMIVLATSFEFFRASIACRVDMVLTTCLVGGVLALYSSTGKPLRVLWAILLFTGATLTKGPVGTLLPCLALGIYMLFAGKNFFSTVFKLFAIALASFLIPALWYWLAYRQGGEAFVELAWEENIGRLIGSMGYESHVNPWYYNVSSILLGFLPWTVPFLIAIFFRSIRHEIAGLFKRVRDKSNSFWLLSITASVIIFVFYCIPESKRSVYLLPCYPFLAFGVASVLQKLHNSRLMMVWANILAVISIIAPIAIITASFSFADVIHITPPRWYQWPMAVLPIIVGLWWLATRSRRANGLAGSLMLTYVVLLGYAACYAPMIMNPRSDFHAAQKILNAVPQNDKIVTRIPEDSLMRYYSLNFYLNDRLRKAGENIAPNEWLLTGVIDGSDAAQSQIITERSSDTRDTVYLVSPQGR